jgi:hypothetical protein
MAIAVHMSFFLGSAEHRGALDDVLSAVVEPRWESHAAPVACEGIPHDGVEAVQVEAEGEAVAAAAEDPALVADPWRRKARGGDAVGRIQRGGEDGSPEAPVEIAQERGFPVLVGAEAAEEDPVGDEEAPALADDRGAGEGGRQRREADENLREEILVFQRG